MHQIWLISQLELIESLQALPKVEFLNDVLEKCGGGFLYQNGNDLIGDQRQSWWQNISVLFFGVFIEIDGGEGIKNAVGHKLSNISFFLSQFHDISVVIQFQFEIDSNQNSSGSKMIIKFLIQINQL